MLQENSLVVLAAVVENLPILGALEQNSLPLRLITTPEVHPACGGLRYLRHSYLRCLVLPPGDADKSGTLCQWKLETHSDEQNRSCNT